MGKISNAIDKAYKSNKEASSLSFMKKEHIDDIELISPINAFKDPISGYRDLDKNIVVYHAPNSIEAEAIKVLRTNLLFTPNGNKSKSILVTSAIPGDGKSFLSANLAVSIAKGVEEHVVLIDADIRKSSIDKIFGIKKSKGLSEYLATGENVAEYFCKTAIHKLTVISAGKTPSNPTELLTSKKMRTLLSEVVERYKDRYVIIDSAPPSLASETIAISKYVDGVVLVVRSGKTPRRAITEAIEQLGKDKILGIVFNFADQAAKKYYSYGKSYYKPKS